MLFPRFIPDAITGGLIILAVLPWMSPILKSIEVAGLGKLELKVEEVKEKQALVFVFLSRPSGQPVDRELDRAPRM